MRGPVECATNFSVPARVLDNVIALRVNSVLQVHRKDGAAAVPTGLAPLAP